MKTCNKCLKEKSYDNYTKRYGSELYESICNDCRIIQQRTYYKRMAKDRESLYTPEMKVLHKKIGLTEMEYVKARRRKQKDIMQRCKSEIFKMISTLQDTVNLKGASPKGTRR